MDPEGEGAQAEGLECTPGYGCISAVGEAGWHQAPSVSLSAKPRQRVPAHWTDAGEAQVAVRSLPRPSSWG